MKISVVIPVYGCREVLKELHERLTKEIVNITKNYEIIFVNDNCPQNSIEMIKEICKVDKKVIGIELSRNFGQMKAILAGLDYSTGDYVVVMDCDLQDKPEEIINLYNKLLEGYDIVFARRKNRKDSFLKIFISKTFYKIYSISTGIKYDSSLCNFSISKKNVIESYCKMREEHRAFVMYIKWLGFNQAILDVEHDKRKEGNSSYNLKKRIKLALDILFSQSDKLLKGVFKFGLFMSFISFLLIIYFLIAKISKPVSWDLAIIMGFIAFMCGIILVAIGIVGIYIGHIFTQVKERPLYAIRNIMNDKGRDSNE